MKKIKFSEKEKDISVGERVCTFYLSPDKSCVTVAENCCDHYTVDLSKQELVELIFALLNLNSSIEEKSEMPKRTYTYFNEDAPPVALVSQPEYERLKRLDENVKQAMQQLLTDLESPDSLLSEYGQKIILEQYKLLEGLLK